MSFFQLSVLYYVDCRALNTVCQNADKLNGIKIALKITFVADNNK